VNVFGWKVAATGYGILGVVWLVVAAFGHVGWLRILFAVFGLFWLVVALLNVWKRPRPTVYTPRGHPEP
jgi:hypothetical protein